LRVTQRARQFAIEVEQLAERPLPDTLDFDGGMDAVDFGLVDAPFRLAVAARCAFEQLAGRGD